MIQHLAMKFENHSGSLWGEQGAKLLMIKLLRRAIQMQEPCGHRRLRLCFFLVLFCGCPDCLLGCDACEADHASGGLPLVVAVPV